jgi:hypothetical protein
MKLYLLAAASLLLVLAGGSCETGSDARSRSAAAENLTAGQQPGGALAEAAGQSGAGPSSAGEAPAASGEAQMKALAQAYAGRIAKVAFREGDWAVRIGDTWYFWAHGRLLPEQLRRRWEEYASYRFYSYSRDLPPLRILDEVAGRALRERLQRAAVDPPERHQGFLADLYGAASRAETESNIVTVSLMGFEVRVHRYIAEPLERVDSSLKALMQTDAEARSFVAGLKGVAGYNWREIAGTRSRSYHSYGLAVDLAPKSFGGKQTYWRWAMPQTDQWYAIPYERRWMVPAQIVKLFEDQGFVWGGKWFFFDTMHFEYRPEIFILAAAEQDG